MCHWLGIVDPTLRSSCILSGPRSPPHKTIMEGFVAVVRSKNASPTWSELLDFDRAGLRGLVQDLYTASEDNEAFLHARLGLGHDQLQPFKACMSYLLTRNIRWVRNKVKRRTPGSWEPNNCGTLKLVLYEHGVSLEPWSGPGNATMER